MPLASQALGSLKLKMTRRRLMDLSDIKNVRKNFQHIVACEPIFTKPTPYIFFREEKEAALITTHYRWSDLGTIRMAFLQMQLFREKNRLLNIELHKLTLSRTIQSIKGKRK